MTLALYAKNSYIFTLYHTHASMVGLSALKNEIMVKLMTLTL